MLRLFETPKCAAVVRKRKGLQSSYGQLVTAISCMTAVLFLSQGTQPTWDFNCSGKLGCRRTNAPANLVPSTSNWVSRGSSKLHLCTNEGQREVNIKRSFRDQASAIWLCRAEDHSLFIAHINMDNCMYGFMQMDACIVFNIHNTETFFIKLLRVYWSSILSLIVWKQIWYLLHIFCTSNCGEVNLQPWVLHIFHFIFWHECWCNWLMTWICLCVMLLQTFAYGCHISHL